MLSCNVSYFCYLESVVYSVVGRLFVRVGGYMRFEKGKDVWSPVFFCLLVGYLSAAGWCWAVCQQMCYSTLVNLWGCLFLVGGWGGLIFFDIYWMCTYIHGGWHVHTHRNESGGETWHHRVPDGFPVPKQEVYGRWMEREKKRRRRRKRKNDETIVKKKKEESERDREPAVVSGN